MRNLSSFVTNAFAAGRDRYWPMRGLKTIRSLRTVAVGHAFVQNLRRGHYEI